MKVETGVIAVAGSGTRMLPVTRGYPKELLPIINRPAIHLIIEEFIDSGIRRIVLITGENPDPLRRTYDTSNAPTRGKYQALDEFLDKLTNIEIILEPQVGSYGNGTPLIVARRFVPSDQGLIYAYGDDLIKSTTPFAKKLIERHEMTGALVVGTQQVPWEEVERYGIAQLKEGSIGGELSDVIEKPPRSEARSNLAMFGRFLLSDEVIQILTEIPKGKANELWLTDAVREYIRRGGRVVTESVADGHWLTIGDPVNYLKTLIEYAMSDEELRKALEPKIRELLGK